MLLNISGLSIGLLFGFLLKRGRFSTGTIRDIYLEKSTIMQSSILAIIAAEDSFIRNGWSTVVPSPPLRFYSMVCSSYRWIHLRNRAVLCGALRALSSGRGGRIIGTLSLIVLTTGILTNKWILSHLRKRLWDYRRVVCNVSLYNTRYPSFICVSTYDDIVSMCVCCVNVCVICRNLFNVCNILLIILMYYY